MVSKNDLSSNFFATKEDIDTNSLADITQRGLMEINNFEIVMIYKGELANNFTILNESNLVIITEIISLEMAENLNQYCRMKKIGFIYASEFGISSFLFTDFGDDFVIEDNNGLEPEKYYIKSITNDCPGIVEIDPIENTSGKKNYLKIGTGDFVSFRDVKGMTELNDTPPRPVRVIDKTKFTIEDTSKLQEFTGTGIVEEVKVPRPAIFKPLSEAINVIYYEDVIEDYLNEDSGLAASKMSTDLMSDDILMGSIGNPKKSLNNNNSINEEKKENIPWIKMFYGEFENESIKSFINEKMHLAFLTLHEYFNIHQDLPNFNQYKEIDECIGISLKILSKAKEEGYKWAINLSKIDKPFLENIFKFCKFNFTPLTNFLGGIVAEEVIKYTGIFKPPNQWVYFNFFNLVNLSLINNDITNKINNLKKDEENNNIDYSDILNIFNEIFTKEINNINILIIGLNDISYEILKLLITLGLLETKENKIIILCDDKYEINQKLNDLKNYGKNNNVIFIQESIDIKNNKYEEKDWWNKSNIIIDSLLFNSHAKEKIFLINQSKKNNKILISLNASNTDANYEIFLPENKNNNLNYIIEEETPLGDEEKNEIKLEENKDEEEDYDKYRNLCTLDEAINWSKNYFINNFIIYIKYLNELIDKSSKESDANMIKHIEKILTKEKEKEKDKDSDITIQLIKIFKKLVTLKLGMNYETIVFYSIEIFEELFSNNVDKILQKYPSDLLIKNSNKKFWSGKRKEPKKIPFDINNEEHFYFIYSMTYLFCDILKFSDIDKKMKNIKEVIEKYEPKKPNSVNIKKMKLKEYSYIEKSSLIQMLKSQNKENLLLKELELNFDKDNENFDNIKQMNIQLNFIILTANIKLSIFGLNESNKSNAICKVMDINLINPCVASSIAGITVMQLLGLVFKDKKEENNKEENNKEEDIKEENNINIINEKNNNNNDNIWIKNCIINLANNTYLFFDLNEN